MLTGIGVGHLFLCFELSQETHAQEMEGEFSPWRPQMSEPSSSCWASATPGLSSPGSLTLVLVTEDAPGQAVHRDPRPVYAAVLLQLHEATQTCFS